MCQYHQATFHDPAYTTYCDCEGAVAELKDDMYGINASLRVLFYELYSDQAINKERVDEALCDIYESVNKHIRKDQRLVFPTHMPTLRRQNSLEKLAIDMAYAAANQ